MPYKGTPERIVETQRRIRAGETFASVARHFHVNIRTIKNWYAGVTSGYRAHSPQSKTGVPPATLRDVEARLREIPPDTRDLTARFLGDPLPGRRAIDLRSVTWPNEHRTSQ